MVTTQNLISSGSADEKLALLTSQDVQVRIHTGNPGVGGTANAATGLDPIVMEPEDWTAPATDTITEDYGGRFVANAGEEVVGLATTGETATWISLWHEDDPGGSPGVFDVWRHNIELNVPVPYNENDPVTIPAGALIVFISAAYPMAAI